MMGMFQKEIKVTETDNGFVVEWDNGKLATNAAINQEPQPTRGLEVYKTKKEVLARVGQFF